MKNSASTIPLKQRAQMALDPLYSICSLWGQEGHKCGGRITWEHTMTYGGKKVQIREFIISLCERGHAINNYLDAGTMNKEMNVWVALNRASEDQLKALSKAEDLVRKKEYLNGLYGKYMQKFPAKMLKSRGINSGKEEINY